MGRPATGRSTTPRASGRGAIPVSIPAGPRPVTDARRRPRHHGRAMGTMTGTVRWSRMRRHPHAGAFCLFALVIGGVYWPVLDGTRSLITNGPVTRPLFVIDSLGGGAISAPLTHLAAASWSHLRLPVVDPFQGFGIPLLADQGVPVYPPQVIAHLLFPGNYSIWHVVNLVLLAFGVYLLARAFGQRFFGGMAAGVLAALAGAVPPNINTSVPNPLAVLPFVLVAVRYAVDPASTHRRAATLGIATSVGFLCLSGFQELLPLMAVVIVVYTVALIVHYRTWRVGPLLVVRSAASAAAGVVVGSIGIIPTLSVVAGGTGVNGSGSHLTHSPVYWLSIFTFPTITGGAMNQAPQSLGNNVNAVGTPLLVLVVVLALMLALRPAGAGTRWFVFPSVVLVVLGVLAYADIGHVLQLMDVPMFDRIASNRFLQFGWWVPLCLLLGTVISDVRMLRWKDLLVALVAAGAFDGYVYERFREALVAGHVASDPSVARAPLVAAVVVVLFVAGIVSLRWIGGAVAAPLMAAIVLASCVYDVPTNFAPARDGGALASVKVLGSTEPGGDQLDFFGIRQLPTQQYSVQLWGPLIPNAYRVALSRLFSATQTDGFGPLYVVAPTLGLLTLTRRAVSALRSMGVDLLVLANPLSGVGFTSIRACGHGHAHGSDPLCFLGEEPSRTVTVAGSPAHLYLYRVLGADPLVQPTATPVAVRSTKAAVRQLSAVLSPSARGLPVEAYVTTSASDLRTARDDRGLTRHATTEEVSISLHSDGSGLAVLKEGYEPGMHATVDGRRARVFPVDGGLWVAVHVGAGTSHVVLDYETTADLVELWLAVAGLALLGALWAGLAASGLLRRRSRLQIPSAGDRRCAPVTREEVSHL